MKKFRKQKGEGEEGCIIIIAVILLIVSCIMGYFLWSASREISLLKMQLQPVSASTSEPTPIPTERVSEEKMQEERENQYIEMCLTKIVLGENVAYVSLPHAEGIENFDRTKIAIKFLTKLQQKKDVQVISWHIDRTQNELCITFFKTSEAKSKDVEKTEKQKKVENQAETPNQNSKSEVTK